MSQKPAWLTTDGAPWGRGRARLVYDNPWIRVTEHDAVAPTGAAAVYGLVEFKNLALAILPVFDDGTIMLVGQARFPAQDYSWELPEGGGPLGVDPLESARRELREETGLEAAQWLPILEAQLSNSVTDERAIGYLATGLTEVEADPDETELLALARVPFREALDAAMAGHMKDMLTVAMLLRGYHMAREGSLPGALARAMLS
ncbi:NUDIX domain-containing protein [Phenylobacterium sp.]|uniref:NUDIX domain-containing protein n=1 Tax=Phenylobacterium sp. TaxID=1871053 RepID=UPI0035B3F85D